jgi:hypothetical protein
MRKRSLVAFAVTALAALAVGLSVPASAASPTPTAVAVNNFTALTPSVRVLDTRTTNNTLGHAQTLALALANHNGVPTNATAVTLNVTVTNQTANSYLSLVPGGQQHGPSQVSFNQNGGNVTDEVTVALGSGAVSIFNFAGSVDVVVDLAGYYSPISVSAPLSGPVTATASTAVSNRSDSGAHGTWAKDAFTRAVTITRHDPVSVSNCGGNATNGVTSCFYYTGSITDGGSFITISGANSPNAGTPINGVVAGTLTGGSAVEFYASSGTPDASLVPATFSGDGVSSTDWVKQFFVNGTSFNTPNEINWAYHYSASATCETWDDNYNNGAGNQPADGDIVGVNHC